MKGFTLIEAIFSVAIFLIVILGVYEAYRALYLSAAASEQKLAALELAMSRFELARSLPYEELGTVGGEPAGPLETEQSLTRNGFAFGVGTQVTEDSGVKLVEVSVDCEVCRNFQSLSLTGRFSP